TLAVWGWPGADIQLWDTATAKSLHARPGHGHMPMALAVSPDGKMVASGAMHDNTLRLWEAATGKPLHQLQTPDHSINVCCFSADGKVVISGGDPGSIQMWDTATGKVRRQFVPGAMPVYGLHLSPDINQLTAIGVNNQLDGTYKAKLRIWDTETGAMMTDR